MGLTQSTSQSKTFLSVGYGKIRQRSVNGAKVDEHTAGAVYRSKPDKPDKGTWAIEYDALVGNIVNIFYRTSGFGSATGGWISIPNSSELNEPISGPVQFKIAFSSIGFLSQTPPQLSDFDIVTLSNTEISSNFEYSHDDSSSGTPTRCAFRLKYAYDSGVIPTTLDFRAYDLTNALLVSHNITTNASNFEYSTNNGASWSALGTIPNVVGTLVRYTFVSPPGVDVRVTLQDT